MGIDGIGKNGKNGVAAPPSRSERGGASPPAGADRPFEVTGPKLENSASDPAPPVGPAGSPRGALERLRAGELDVRGYVELKVNDATAHLAALPPRELETLRGALRTRMASDPCLAELVRTVAGGRAPELPSED